MQVTMDGNLKPGEERSRWMQCLRLSHSNLEICVDPSSCLRLSATAHFPLQGRLKPGRSVPVGYSASDFRRLILRYV